MKATERLGLIATATVAAFSSAAAVYVFAPFPDSAEPAAITLREDLPRELTRSTPKSARLAMPVPDEQAEPLASASSGDVPIVNASYEPDTDQARPAQGENPDSWSSETNAGADWQTNVTAPAQPKSESLPWQSETHARVSPPPAQPERSLRERLSEISPAAMKRVKEKFEAVNAGWPPAEISLIALKDKKVIDLYARPAGGKWQHIHRYPVLAASGTAGPKLRQGDKQVPEGIYSISFLNPNSRYHVSMRLNYPNDFDRQMAANDGRKELGGDIMIHGKAVSIGCLAVGDEAAEELFVLAAETGLPNVKVIIAPADFRRDTVPGTAEPGQPRWLPKLYTQVASALNEYPAPPGSGLLSFFGN